jgi:hypothetical protein
MLNRAGTLKQRNYSEEDSVSARRNKGSVDLDQLDKNVVFTKVYRTYVGKGWDSEFNEV